MNDADKWLVLAGLALLSAICAVVVHWSLVAAAMALAFFCVIQSKKEWHK